MVFVVSLEFFIFVVAIIAIVALAIFLAVAAVSLWTMVATLSVTFSRLAISVLISAGILFTGFDLAIFENGFLNFLARFVIIYGVIWIASFIPRVEPAIGTVCTFFISMITTMLTLGFGLSILSGIIKSETNFTDTWWANLILAIVVLIATTINWLRDLDRVKERANGPTIISKPIFIRVGRVIASIIYGFVILIIIALALGTAFTPTVWLQYVMLFVCSAVAYVADLFLFDRAAPPKKKIAAED